MFAFSFQPWGNILLWLAVVVIAIIVEIETLQIVSIWFAVSGLVTMILAAFNCPIEIQIIVFVVLSVILFLCSRPIVKKINRSKSENSTIESMIGEEVVVIKEIKVGDLSPTRDFNFVKDTCRGFLDIAKAANTAGEEINICTDTEVSMQETLNCIAKIMNSEINWVKDPERCRPSKSEVFRLHGSNKKICSLTDWQPKYSLEDGLKETIEWFTNKENLKKYKSTIYNR